MSLPSDVDYSGIMLSSLKRFFSAACLIFSAIFICYLSNSVYSFRDIYMDDSLCFRLTMEVDFYANGLI